MMSNPYAVFLFHYSPNPNYYNEGKKTVSMIF